MAGEPYLHIRTVLLTGILGFAGKSARMAEVIYKEAAAKLGKDWWKK
jgi:hypothetical protein